MRAIVLVFLAVLVCAQTEKAPNCAIHGVITDTTGLPVAGVTIDAFPGDAGPRVVTMSDGTAVTVNMQPRSSITDADGSYGLGGLMPASYTVRARRDGAIAASRQVKLDPGQDVAIDLVIPANPSIGGRVLDQDKQPVVDAFVWLLRPEYQDGVLRQAVTGPKVTGEDGSYAFDSGLEANRGYFILVDRQIPEELMGAAAADLKERAPIETPTYYPSATRMDAATAIVLAPGERREQVDIRVATAPFYCVDGKVQISGKPTASDFTIQAAALAGTRFARVRSGAGEDGAFHACGLTPDAYRLSSDAGFTEFTIANSDLHRVDLSTEKANLRLEVRWDEPPPPPKIPKLDAAGEAALRELAVEAGMATNEDDLQKLAMLLYSPTAFDTPGLREASTRLMQKDPDFSRKMSLVARQLGLVPMNGVNVTLSGAAVAGDISRMTPIPFDGPFRESIPSGNYRVLIQPGADSYTKELAYNGLALQGGNLHVGPGSTGTLSVVIARGAATLAVDVADGDGKPVGDAWVIVLPDSVASLAELSRSAIRGQTDQNGSFSRQLPPGKYRVLATAQTVRWAVPEDLQKVLLVLFQAKEVELSAKDKAQISVTPAPI